MINGTPSDISFVLPLPCPTGLRSVESFECVRNRRGSAKTLKAGVQALTIYRPEPTATFHIDAPIRLSFLGLLSKYGTVCLKKVRCTIQLSRHTQE
jgi:hypothetical protein